MKARVCPQAEPKWSGKQHPEAPAVQLYRTGDQSAVTSQIPKVKMDLRARTGLELKWLQPLGRFSLLRPGWEDQGITLLKELAGFLKFGAR